MAQSFTIGVVGKDVKALVEKATKTLAANQITLDGNEVSGVFSGRHVHGQYIVAPDEILFTVNSKPIFLAEDEVEGWIKEGFV